MRLTGFMRSVNPGSSNLFEKFSQGIRPGENSGSNAARLMDGIKGVVSGEWPSAPPLL